MQIKPSAQTNKNKNMQTLSIAVNKKIFSKLSIAAPSCQHLTEPFYL
jgi:hypothetical protein